MEVTKRCSKCKTTKPISEFHKNRAHKDGHCNECKICHLPRCKEYRQTDQSKVAQSKANKKYTKTVKGKVAGRRKMLNYYARHPERLKAKSAVNNAIANGKLISPKFLLCHYCPKPAQHYHHWHGYAPKHWLDVVPVCVNCHRKYDKKIA